MREKIMTADALASIAGEMRARGKRLVFTNGCFDLLHVGHVRYLAAARALGDALAVGINGDASVRQLKGAGRPLNNEVDRAAVVAGLASVDYVAIFPEVRATRLLSQICPAVYVKGGDYTEDTLNPEERRQLEICGTEIRIVPFEGGHSTSQLIARMRSLES
ncbi:MAG: adenylyltransferase/cytidyltransferase family protein [Chthoniobacterales bacterium]